LVAVDKLLDSPLSKSKRHPCRWLLSVSSLFTSAAGKAKEDETEDHNRHQPAEAGVEAALPVTAADAAENDCRDDASDDDARHRQTARAAHDARALPRWLARRRTP
jgi:hypothetical protein